ncbi:MAG: hypothetical protein ACE15E_07010 [Acidobacteriota bacterium]
MAHLARSRKSCAKCARRLPSETRLAVFRQALLDWWQIHGRRFPWRKANGSDYSTAISEILLQRTQAEQVAKVFQQFVTLYPSWDRLAQASEDQLQNLLQPLGLWRRRASTILALAHEMKRRHGQFPAERSEVEALPGVGQYIGNAILLLCHDQAQPLLDVNMSRVLERNFGPRQLVDIRYDPYLQELASRVVAKGDARALNWAILDLAALVCLQSGPRCSSCPLVSSCRFGRTQAAELQSRNARPKH